MRQAGRQPEKGGCGRAPPAGRRVRCAFVAQACSARARLAGHRISCASSAPACSGRARPAGRLVTCLFAGKTSYGPAPLAGHRNAPAPAAPAALQAGCAGTAAAAAIRAGPRACRCHRGARGLRARLAGHLISLPRSGLLSPAPLAGTRPDPGRGRSAACSPLAGEVPACSALPRWPGTGTHGPQPPSALQTNYAGTAAAAAISADPQACRCRRGARGRRAPLTGHL